MENCEKRRLGAILPSAIELVVLLVILCLAGFLRFEGLEREGLFMDEVRQARISRGGYPDEKSASLINPLDWARLVHRAAYQGQPPLEYALQRFANLFGHGEISQRFFPATFGMLTVLLFFVVGYSLKSTILGLLMSAILALNPAHIEWSQTGRPYAITLFFWCLHLIVILHVDKVPSRKNLCLLAVVTLLFSLTRTDVPVFACFVMGLIFLWQKKIKLLISMALGFLIYFPLMVFIRSIYSNYVSNANSSQFTYLFDAWRDLLGPVWLLQTTMVFLGIGCLIVTVFNRKEEDNFRTHVLLVAPVLTVIAHLGYWISTVSQPLHVKYLIYLLLPSAVLISLLPEYILKRSGREKVLVPIAVSLILIFLFPLAYDSKFIKKKEGWREVHDKLLGEEVDQLWMASTVLKGWIPPYFGRWYGDEIRTMSWTAGEKLPSLGGKTAILIWDEPPHFHYGEHMKAIDGYELFKAHGLYLYVPMQKQLKLGEVRKDLHEALSPLYQIQDIKPPSLSEKSF